jgi:hypothetical protein
MAREELEIGEVVTVEDSSGTELDVEVIDIFELNGTEYIVMADFLQMLEEDNSNIDIFFVKWDEDDELVSVDEDLEFRRVTKYFEKLCEQAGNGLM